MTESIVKPLAAKTCLQCGETQEVIKRDDLSCAIMDGYWEREPSEEWDDHHFDDWSDEELDEQGIPEDQREAVRRYAIWDLRSAANDTKCDQEGHDEPLGDVCPRCFRTVDKGSAS